MRDIDKYGKIVVYHITEPSCRVRLSAKPGEVIPVDNIEKCFIVEVPESTYDIYRFC